MFESAQRLSNYVWFGPKANRLCLSRPKIYPIMFVSAQCLSVYVWFGPKANRLCLSRPKVYPIMFVSAQSLSVYVWVGPKSIRFFVKQISDSMIMEIIPLTIFMILPGTPGSYLLPVQQRAKVNFKVCVRLCRFWSSLMWSRVVWYCTGVNRGFCYPHFQDILSHTVCPDDGSSRILYNICILLLDCTAS